MTTPTEPAARLTVEPLGVDQYGNAHSDFRIECPHGWAAVENLSDVKPDWTIVLVAQNHQEAHGCHCADQIRARYGAGGEGEP